MTLGPQPWASSKPCAGGVSSPNSMWGRCSNEATGQAFAEPSELYVGPLQQ